MDDQDEGAEESIVEVKVNYDYLLSMPINSLTLEKVHSLPLSCLLHSYWRPIESIYIPTSGHIYCGCPHPQIFPANSN